MAWRVVRTSRTMLVESDGATYSQSYNVISDERFYSVSTGGRARSIPQISPLMSAIRTHLEPASIKELACNEKGDIYALHDHEDLNVLVVTAVERDGGRTEVQMRTRGPLETEEVRYAMGVFSALAIGLDIEVMKSRLVETSKTIARIVNDMSGYLSGDSDE